MQLNKILIFSLITGIFFALNLSGQSIVDSVYNKNIHTIQIYRDGNELSYPFIELNSADKLKLCFDDFSNEVKNYYYSLVHCNSNWEPSDISTSEYIDGFAQNQITSHMFSINTLINYIHYSVLFPNENCKPKISGNYLIKVYEDFDETKLAFIKRFYITETTASINLEISRPDIPKYMLKGQQFKITVMPNVSDFTDLKNEIKIVINQNGMPCRTKSFLLFRLINGTTLVYDDLDSNIFDGGNEFRNFDIKSIKFQSARIKKIEYSGQYYTIQLLPDDWRTKTRYFFDNDLNGNYFIENSLGIDKTNDADYVMVCFNLPTKEPLIDGDIYVYGALTNWKCDQASKMKYNLETQAYELKLLLKQGYCNYQYAYKPINSNEVDLTFVEGNHYETENDYLVFVYYKQFSSRYERLIGLRIANSIKKPAKN
jgi:hypothetical protein